MIKIFADIEENAEIYTVAGEDFLHLKVLRINVNEEIFISDKKEFVYRSVVENINNDGIILRIMEKIIFKNEPRCKITLYQSLLKGDKNEFVIQKCVELGINRIVFFQSEHCVAVNKKEKTEQKLERYNKIAKSAAIQSTRDIIPAVSGFCDYKTMINSLIAQPNTQNIIFHEKSELKLSAHYNATTSDISIIIGPEGGFSDKEIDFAQKNNGNIKILSLGNRILRAETASITAMSVIMSLHGEI